MASNDNQFTKFIMSFVHAANGFTQAIKNERNLKIHCVITVLVIIAGFYFKIKAYEWLVILLCIGLSISMELMNTALEKAVDLVTNYEFHPLAKKSKDIAASAVLISAIISALVGVIIFLPYIWQLIKS